jgi:hypothetical protein
MSLALAMKRSYRFFLPRSLLNPRRLARQLLPVAFFYVIVLSTGMYVGARGIDQQHVTEGTVLAMLVLIVLRLWAGKAESRDSAAEA